MSAGVIAPPASRNSPCPCGSGRRYKDCHGALDGGTAPALRTSTYRAPPNEWSGVSESDADRLGGLMEQALAHQLAGRNEEAARLYGEVLQAVPRTHDALHMLGVIELAAGNLEDAERLIREAHALRPPYPTITHNLQLVHDAIAARDRSAPEELCERALPLFVELALTSDAQHKSGRTRSANGTLHLIGHTERAGRDENWLLHRLAALLAPARPTLWSVDAGPFAEVDGVPAIGIDAASGFVPQGGVHVFVGIGLPGTEWIERADADRVVVVCTAAPPSLFLDQLRAIAWDGARPIELVFTSPALAARFGGVGSVLPLPIELPDARRPTSGVTFGTWTIEPPAPFVVGVVGQDGPDVDEPRGTEFLSQLARSGGELAVYDAGRLRYQLGADPLVRCLARAPGALGRFLSTLDCFVHRARPWWEEGDGRTLLTAMALGVPVLCPRDSLFAAEVRDGVDGVLYADEAHALQVVAELHRAPAWAQSLGSAARARSAERFDPAKLAASYRAALVGTALVESHAAWPA